MEKNKRMARRRAGIACSILSGTVLAALVYGALSAARYQHPAAAMGTLLASQFLPRLIDSSAEGMGRTDPAPVDDGGLIGAGAGEAAAVPPSAPGGGEKTIRQTTALSPEAANTGGFKPLRISYVARYSNTVPASVTVHFSVDDPPADAFQSFEWDLGNGKREFRAELIYEYTVPKTYAARLTATDAAGTVYRSEPLYIDLPYPGMAAEYSTTQFVTLSSPDDYFAVQGEVTGVARYPGVEAAPLELGESDQYRTTVRFKKPGFYGLTVREAGRAERSYSVFVSPLPSKHCDGAGTNFNWYRTQFNTGTTSNCGPAAASMAIAWSTGTYFPVASIRQALGWQGEGGTSFEELISVIREQGIPALIAPIRNARSIMDVIDSGGIAVVLFRTDGVRTAKGDPAANLMGKYYDDSVGHYIVIKGYSLDGEYFIIHDPIPSDWSSNSFRYGDELSMIGQNRYYPAAELLRSLRRSDMIVAPVTGMKHSP